MRFKWGIVGIALAIGIGPVNAAEHQTEYKAAAAAAASKQVDIALVLAVDVSASVDEGEAGIQRAGYISAMRDPKVVDAIKGGLNGRIAVAFVEWASPSDQRLLVDWHIISDADSANAFAEELEKAPYKPGSTTSISAGLDYSVKLIATSGLQAIRRVVDISGDGYSEYGRPIKESRDMAVKAGVTVNGLPVMNERAKYREAIPPDLDKYYTENVTGGRGAFTLPVKKLEDFPRLILQKLILEIASLEARPPLPFEAIEVRKPS